MDQGLGASGFPTTATPDGYFQARINCSGGDCNVLGAQARFETVTGGPTAVLVRASNNIDFSNAVDIGTFAITPGAPSVVTVPYSQPGVSGIIFRFYPINATSSPNLNSVTLGEITINGTVDVGLPLDFVAVSARADGNDISVSWTTAQQRDVAYFEVLTGFGESPTLRTAARLDAGPDTVMEQVFTSRVPALGKGTNYVQLLAIDHDGSETRSELISVEAASSGKNFVIVHRDRDQAVLQSEVATRGFVTSAAGQRLAELSFDADGRAALDLTTLPAGVLFVTAGTETIRIAVQH